MCEHTQFTHTHIFLDLFLNGLHDYMIHFGTVKCYYTVDTDGGEGGAENRGEIEGGGG